MHRPLSSIFLRAKLPKAFPKHGAEYGHEDTLANHRGPRAHRNCRRHRARTPALRRNRLERIVPARHTHRERLSRCLIGRPTSVATPQPKALSRGRETPRPASRGARPALDSTKPNNAHWRAPERKPERPRDARNRVDTPSLEYQRTCSWRPRVLVTTSVRGGRALLRGRLQCSTRRRGGAIPDGTAKPAVRACGRSGGDRHRGVPR